MNKNIFTHLKFKKYVNSFRQLVIQTPSIQNEKYIQVKQFYNDFKKQMHQKNIKLNTFIHKDYVFGIYLIDYNGILKKKYSILKLNNIIKNDESLNKRDLDVKKNNKHLTLYEDYHPQSSLKGVGFKDEKTAFYTLEIIKNKPLNYQLSVVVTMLNRAKFHPHQTANMKKAIQVYEKWLKEYHHKKQKGGNNYYPFLNHDIIHYFDTLAEYYDISKRARGLEKPLTTNKGFLQVYLKNSNKNKLKNIPVKKSNPNGANWYQTRINRLNAKLGQMKLQKIPFFHESGILKGLPTKMHTILIMWAYSPYESKIKQLMKKNDLKNLKL